jgi:glycosyltransferase involved in cell wall biosynthesis
MRRVLLTVHKFFPQHRAGTEVLTLKVAQDLQRRGYEVLVVTANPPDLDARHPSPTETSDYEYEGVRVHVIEESLRLDRYTFTHEYVHEGIGRHFAGILKSFAPDLVHSFHCQNVSASIIDVALEASIPVVFSATDFWFVCPVVQLKRPDGALCRGPSQFASNCLTCYTPQLFPPASQVKEAIERKYIQVGRLISRLPAPIANVTTEVLKTAYVASKLPAAIKATVKRPKTLRERLNRVEKVMVATKLMQDIFIENGIRPEIIKHVPFGLDIEPLLPFQNKVTAGQLRIGFIGTIFEHKGLDLLVQAFQSLPDAAPAILRIYGDMNQFPDYAESIRQLVLAHPAKAAQIEFAGTFPNSELGSVLQNLDVLVVPSRWYENTPLVIQSALTTKTPVVATDLGGMSELIRHEFNGLLFELNDHQSLAKQLLRLLNEKGLLQRLISNIPPERTIAQMVDEIEIVYDAIGIKNWQHKHNSSKHELAAN